MPDNGHTNGHSKNGNSHSLGEALVVDDDPVVRTILQTMLGRLGYVATGASGAAEGLKRINRHVPEVILTDILMPGMDGLSFCRKIRQDRRTAAVPVIMISTETKLEERLQGFRAGADDYISKPFNVLEVRARLDRLISRNQRAIACNPLSRLPGNPSIEAEANRRLAEKKPFAFAYIDIDNFKSFNDVYGYNAGDRVIKDLARLLVAASGPVSRQAFVGHVGGDDFVIVSSPKKMRDILDVVLSSFDDMAKQYYSAADQRRGGLTTANRQYKKQFFPIMTLTCAVISTAIRRISHYAELAEIASELKHHLKAKGTHQGSRAQWNGRSDRRPPNSRLKKSARRGG